MSTQPIELFKSAVSRGDAPHLQALLGTHPELHAQLNAPIFPFGARPLAQAAGRDSRDVIDVLLKAGADINARSDWWAGSFGVLDSASPALAAYLLERGARLDVHAASRLGMLDELMALVAAQPESVHARGGDGKTPLHFASTTAVAEYLLAQGAAIDALDIDHESTPAQHLIQSHPEVARYLIERGCGADLLLAAAAGRLDLVDRYLDADPESIRMRVNERFFPMRDPRAGGTIYIWTLGKNRSAHQVAHKFGHPAVLRQLFQRSPPAVKLTNAFAIGDDAIVTEALRAQPDLIAALSDEDARQICDAAEDNNAAAVRLMLAHGWPVDGRQAITPLHWAAFHGNPTMTAEILKHHPPLDRADPDHGGVPLDWAMHGSVHGWHCQTGDFAAVVEALLNAGAKPSPWPGGSPAVREVLWRHGIDPGD